MVDRKLQMHYSDAPQDMQIAAIEFAAGFIEKKSTSLEIAKELKKDFEKRYFGSWHCIVGNNFGAFVSNEEERVIYFTYGQISILLFKAG